MTAKGMCLDDTTFGDCPSKVLVKWPHTDQPIKILRMFKPCKQGLNCDDKNRHASWQSISKFAAANNVKFLMGYDITDPCDPAKDDQQWSWILDFLQMIGKEQIIALAFGNELDIADTKDCSQKFWEEGYLNLIKSRAADLEKHGFGDLKLSAVFTMSVTDNSRDKSKPFIDGPDGGKLVKANTFLTKAFQAYGKSRWIWSFNVYPYWSSGDCNPYFLNATRRLDEMVADVGVLRERIGLISGNSDDTLFMTETGWSSAAPRPSGDACPGKKYSSLENLKAYYSHFLSWDLRLPNGLKPPDLSFFFTIRDTAPEHFGLVAKCSDDACKLQNTMAGWTGKDATDKLVAV
jgi:hypothetical protein